MINSEIELQKLFLKTCRRAYWHKKYRVRAKNSKRAQKILERIVYFYYKKGDCKEA